MAGHSHWANIAHKKGRIDKKRGALFGKLNRAILVAAQNGGGDPDMNLRLRYAIDKARKASMPKDTIERAIKKGCGELEGEQFVEILYEGYGPGGVAILCDVLTDNRNRTAGNVRKTFEVHGGNLGAAGCVAWMFERKGVCTINKEETDVEEDHLFEIALEAGAEDVVDSGEQYQVLTSLDAFDNVNAALERAKIDTEESEISYVPNSTVEMDADDGRKLLKLLDALEEDEDIQNVNANFDMPDDVMAEVMAETE